MTDCQIVPPYLLERLAAAHPDRTVIERGQRTLEIDARLRRRRTAAPATPAAGDAPFAVYTADHGSDLPGTLVRSAGDAASGDPAVDEAYAGVEASLALFKEVYGRSSYDGKGAPVLATVHYEQDYDNAFWDGTQLVFGDGDGTVFDRFTKPVDVLGHELTHAVTQFTANLSYQGQPGALNESVSDAFGSCLKQRLAGESAADADWLIGEGIFLPSVQGRALRSMKAPGTAYDDPRLGKDPQPADMSGYVQTSDDNGGVHLNSGIPNRAFYLVASAIGGNAWEAPGQVWYDVLTGSAIRPDCDFATFAELTGAAARKRFGKDSKEAAAVDEAWRTVGVSTASTTGTPTTPAGTSDELSVRRTGGFGGLVRERTLRLADLPDDDASHWRSLLSGDRLARLADAPTHPDAFCYGVRCDAARLDVTIPEPALEPDMRDLFERTLAP